MAISSSTAGDPKAQTGGSGPAVPQGAALHWQWFCFNALRTREPDQSWPHHTPTASPQSLGRTSQATEQLSLPLPTKPPGPHSEIPHRRGALRGPLIPTRDRSASLAATPRRPRHCPLTDGKGAASSSALCPEPTARGSLRPSCQTLFVAHGTQNPRKVTAATAKFEKNNKTTSTLKTGPTVLGEMADVQGWGRETTRGGWGISRCQSIRTGAESGDRAPRAAAKRTRQVDYTPQKK